MAVQGEIQIGRISRFFTKWLGTKGQSNPMSISGEIAGVIPLWSGVENRFLESWQLFGVAAVVAAGAGNLSELVIRNPTNSKLIAVLEKVTVACTVLTTFHFDVGAALGGVDKAGVLGPQIRDGRWGNNSGTGLVVTNGSTTGGQIVGTTIGLALVPANATYDFIQDANQEIALSPGSGAQVECETVNTQFFGTFWFRVRALEDSELTG